MPETWGQDFLMDDNFCREHWILLALETSSLDGLSLCYQGPGDMQRLVGHEDRHFLQPSQPLPSMASLYVILSAYSQTVPCWVQETMLAPGHSISEPSTRYNDRSILHNEKTEFLLEVSHSLPCTGKVQYAK